MSVMKSAASCRKAANSAGVTLAATIAPISPCAPRYGPRGTVRCSPFTPNTIPPIIGPNSSPAGSPADIQTSEIMADSATSASHCIGTGQETGLIRG